jgi:D-cysteine desulfhydrase
MSEDLTLSGKIRAAFAPANLGSWPTPLEPASALATALGLEALWLKREDRSSRRYGGNKVRGLEFLLAGIAPRTACVTIGGSGSTHCLATAVHTAACGAQTVLAQFAQPDTPWALAVARATDRHATAVVRSASRVGFPLAVLRAWRWAGRLGPRRWIPGGGAHPRAVIGHLLAALELEAQLPVPPDAIVLPLGTGATAAGVALGVAALGWPSSVIAVRVAPRIVANRCRTMSLARRARRLLTHRSIPLPSPVSPVEVDGLGAGYGSPTPVGESARRLAEDHGLILDSTYGAKAFAALAQRATCNGLPRAQRGVQRIVFWNTFAPPTAELQS